MSQAPAITEPSLGSVYEGYMANIRHRRRFDLLFAALGSVLIVLALGVLVALVGNLISDGAARLSWDFLNSYPSRRAGAAGIKSSIFGTALVMIVTAVTAIPLGVAAGIYLEEYAPKNWITDVIEINIANLAGIPSIIWGLMALGLLIYQFENWFGDPTDNVTGLGRSILTAGLTLGLLVLPIVIVATRESIRSIPQAIREASYACGSTRLQTVRYHVLPYSMPGVLTGSIIALSRAIGETAPLITIGALTFIAFLPPTPLSNKPWLTAANAQVAINPAAVDLPLTSDATEINTAALRTGELAIHTRQPDSKAFNEVIIPFDFSRGPGDPTLNTVRDRIDAISGVTASVDSSGRLTVEAEAPTTFIVARDTTNLTKTLGIEFGGGRHGMFDWIASEFTVLPIQMFNWVSRPDQSFHANAAAAGVILLIVTLVMNGFAMFLRYRLRRNLQW